MTAEELQAIRTRLEQASDGPWSVRRIPNSYESTVGDRRTHPCVRGFRVPRRLYNLAWSQCEADAEFMAQARQDIPLLLSEVDQLRGTLQECHAALKELAARPAASTEDLARVEHYLSEAGGEWLADLRRPADVRRLYMAQAPIRPRDGGMAVKARQAG